MAAHERREKILSLISNEGIMRASELAEHLNVSTETIRKDLIYLNNKNLLRKGHGYVRAINEFIECSIDVRAQENALPKKAIAKAALSQITDRAVIFIDAGSTLDEFSKLLGNQPHLAIVTNSFTAIQTLQETGNLIYFIGGEVNSTTQSTTGFWSTSELQSIKIDIAFLGTSGFQSHSGPCAKHFSDAQFKREVIKNSSRVVILADSAKFTSNAIVQYADWNNIDLLITDKNVLPEDLASLNNKVEVLIADIPDEE